MKTTMMISLVGLVLGGCASAPVPMQKWEHPEMRVGIYAPGITNAQKAAVEDALLESGAFFVVSRGISLETVLEEQDMVHERKADRFDAKHKWSHRGKLRGVGAIVMAQADCADFISHGGYIYQKCRQVLTLIDASTGDHIASATATSGEVGMISPEWTETVQKFLKRIPSDYIEEQFKGRAKDRMIASEKHSEEVAEQLKNKAAGK